MARVDNYEQRFGGIGRLYTPEGLARLRQAHVCVIGSGGWVNTRYVVGILDALKE